MNTDWLWVLPLALGLAGWLLWRLRRRQRRPVARDQAARAAQAARASTATAPQAPPSAIEAQRLAATEALRQARLRKAEQATRVQRQADVQAAVAAPVVPAVVVRVLPPPTAPDATAVPTITSALARSAAPSAAIAAIAAIAPAAPAAPAAQTAERGGVAAAPVAQPTSVPTVLLVDDSKLVRVKTGRLLQHQGWQVLLAEDGLAAWRQFENTAIDLLITDVEMPGLDGFELTRRLRADPRWQALPVIMISGSDDKHQAAAHAAGVDLLLGKPYAEAVLLAQAQRLVGRNVAPAEARLAFH